MRTEREEKGHKKAKQSQNMTLKYQYLLIPLACIRIILILVN